MKRLLCLLLALCMSVSLFAGMTWAAAAEVDNSIAVVLGSSFDVRTGVSTVRLGFTDGTEGTYEVSKFRELDGRIYDLEEEDLYYYFEDNYLFGYIVSYKIAGGKVELSLERYFDGYESSYEYDESYYYIKDGNLKKEGDYRTYWSNDSSVIFLLYTTSPDSRTVKFKVCKLADIAECDGRSVPTYRDDGTKRYKAGGSVLTDRNDEVTYAAMTCGSYGIPDGLFASEVGYIVDSIVKYDSATEKKYIDVTLIDLKTKQLVSGAFRAAKSINRCTIGTRLEDANDPYAIGSIVNFAFDGEEFTAFEVDDLGSIAHQGRMWEEGDYGYYKVMIARMTSNAIRYYAYGATAPDDGTGSVDTSALRARSIDAYRFQSVAISDNQPIGDEIAECGLNTPVAAGEYNAIVRISASGLIDRVFSFHSFGELEEAPNLCGDNLTWTFDEETKTLTISGTGAMWDFPNSRTAPWYYECDYYDLTRVVLEEGVTSIGDYAFQDYYNLEDVMLPSTLEEIGLDAFAGCDRLDLDIPDSVTVHEKSIAVVLGSSFEENSLGAKSVIKLGFADGTEGTYEVSKIRELDGRIYDLEEEDLYYYFADNYLFGYIVSYKIAGGKVELSLERDFDGYRSYDEYDIDETYVVKNGNLKNVRYSRTYYSNDSSVLFLLYTTSPDSRTVKFKVCKLADIAECDGSSVPTYRDDGTKLYQSGGAVLCDENDEVTYAAMTCGSEGSPWYAVATTDVGYIVDSIVKYDSASGKRYVDVTLIDLKTKELISGAFREARGVAHIACGTRLEDANDPYAIGSIVNFAFDGEEFTTFDIDGLGNIAHQECMWEEGYSGYYKVMIARMTSNTIRFYAYGATALDDGTGSVDTSAMKAISIDTTRFQSVAISDNQPIGDEIAECGLKTPVAAGEYNAIVRISSTGLIDKVFSFHSFGELEEAPKLCGDNLTWTFDEETKTLTISGSGDMWDFTHEWYYPWYCDIWNDATVVIEEGVTSIGDYAFKGSGVKSISLPSTLEKIGVDAFMGCYHLELDLPDSVTVKKKSIAVVLGSSVEISALGAKSVIKLGFTDGTEGTYEVTKIRELSGEIYDAEEDDISGWVEDNRLLGSLVSYNIVGDKAEIALERNFDGYRSSYEYDIDETYVVENGNLKNVRYSETYYSNDSSVLFLLYTTNSNSRTVKFKVCKLADAADCYARSVPTYGDDGTKMYQSGGAVLYDENDEVTYAAMTYGSYGSPNVGWDVSASTVNGAQIRVSGNQGLRFISTLDKSGLHFSRVVEYGTILIPSADISDISELQIGATLNGHEVAKVPAVYLYDETKDTVTFTAVITNIAEKNYAREYTARAYAIMDDGSVVYADSGSSRSIYAVAKRGLENAGESEENKATFQAIVDAVENAEN